MAAADVSSLDEDDKKFGRVNSNGHVYITGYGAPIFIDMFRSRAISGDILVEGNNRDDDDVDTLHKFHPESLSKICIDYFIRHPAYISTYFKEEIPMVLMEDLFAEALILKKYSIIEPLLRSWKNSELLISNILRSVRGTKMKGSFKWSDDEEDYYYEKEKVKNNIERAGLIIQACKNIVKKDGRLNFNLIDFHTFPILHPYLEMLKASLQSSNFKLTLVGNFGACDYRQISFLKKYIKSNERCLQLIIKRIYSSSNSSAIPNGLLLELEPENLYQLQGLSLAMHFCRFDSVHYFSSYMIVLGQFKNLRALDLSRNALKLKPTSDESKSVLKSINSSLKNLPHLSRLDISNNCLSGGLDIILKDLANIEYLNLTGCRINVQDLLFLRNECLFLSKLIGLDMSENAYKHEYFKPLLEKLTNIAVLELDYCEMFMGLRLDLEINNEEFESRNDVKSLRDLAKVLTKLPKLKYYSNKVQFDYVHEIYFRNLKVLFNEFKNTLLNSNSSITKLVLNTDELITFEY